MERDAGQRLAEEGRAEEHPRRPAHGRVGRRLVHRHGEAGDRVAGLHELRQPGLLREVARHEQVRHHVAAGEAVAHDEMAQQAAVLFGLPGVGPLL